MITSRDKIFTWGTYSLAQHLNCSQDKNHCGSTWLHVVRAVNALNGIPTFQSAQNANRGHYWNSQVQKTLTLLFGSRVLHLQPKTGHYAST